MTTGLERELQRRATKGQYPVSVRQFEATLQALGYKRDRSMEAYGTAKIMTGDSAGDSYPCITTTPREADTALRFCNADADRGERYRQLQDVRETLFAVTRGAILEI